MSPELLRALFPLRTSWHIARLTDLMLLPLTLTHSACKAYAEATKRPQASSKKAGTK